MWACCWHRDSALDGQSAWSRCAPRDDQSVRPATLFISRSIGGLGLTTRSLAACVREVRSLPGIWYLRSEVADALGVSPATLRRLGGRAPTLGPSAVLRRGSVGVPLYDQAAVDALRETARGDR